VHEIFLALVNNLTGVALVLTSITGLVSVWRNGSRTVHIAAEQEKVKIALLAEQDKQNKQLAVIENKVDGGMTSLQQALASIATTATAQLGGVANAVSPNAGTGEPGGRRADDKMPMPRAPENGPEGGKGDAHPGRK